MILFVFGYDNTILSGFGPVPLRPWLWGRNKLLLQIAKSTVGFGSVCRLISSCMFCMWLCGFCMSAIGFDLYRTTKYSNKTDKIVSVQNKSFGFIF